jgi:hypothetical protein
MSTIHVLIKSSVDHQLSSKHDATARGDIRYLHRGKLHPDGPAQIETFCDLSNGVTLHRTFMQCYVLLRARPVSSCHDYLAKHTTEAQLHLFSMIDQPITRTTLN